MGCQLNIQQNIFHSTVVSKMLYAIQAWWGYTTNSDCNWLESFIKKYKKWEYCKCKMPNLSSLAQQANNKLFKAVDKNNEHILHKFLPTINEHNHNLRPRKHNFTIEEAYNFSYKNFITRMLVY